MRINFTLLEKELTGYSPVMANQKVSIIVVQVHAVSFAIAEHGAIGTTAFFRPFAIAERLKTVVPDIHEIVFVNISLTKIRPDARAG